MEDYFWAMNVEGKEANYPIVYWTSDMRGVEVEGYRTFEQFIEAQIRWYEK